MKRSSFRNLMIISLLACLGLAYFLFTTSQDFQLQIQHRNNDIIQLNQDLENAQNLNVALTELDNLTITEQTATQLDILRHLGLENSDLTFQMEARDVQSIGSSTLYVHTASILGDMEYAAALALADRLQNTKKIVISNIEMRGPGVTSGQRNVSMRLTGLIYGLDKVIPPLEILPAEVAPAEQPSDMIIPEVSQPDAQGAIQ